MMKSPLVSKLRAATLLVPALCLGACASTHDSTRPTPHAANLPSIQMPDTPDGTRNSSVQNGLPGSIWWSRFGDAQLDTLIDIAWQNNYDLRIAYLRLSQAKAQSSAAAGARLPEIDIEASGGRRRLSAVESKSSIPALVSPAEWQLGLSWELDLFGHVRHTIEAANAHAAETEAALHDVKRLLLGQVVEAYLELRGTQMLEACIRQQVDNQNATLKLVREREAAGRTPPAERMRFEAQLRLVESRLPNLIARERAARNRLATLTALPLDAPQLLALDKSVEFKLPAQLIVDEPASLLLRRPDVRMADQAVAVADAREGIARSDRFPRISLSALLGNYGVAGEWLKGEGSRWFGMGSIAAPLFDGGTRAARVEAASAEAQASRINYERVIAKALEETDTAIATWLQMHRRNQELDVAHTLAQESARLARVRYREGAESLLGVLEAERIALDTEEQLVAAKRDLALSTAHCYVAIAGGFDAS